MNHKTNRYGSCMNLRIALNTGFGFSRVIFGLVAATVPEKIGSTWVGEDASRTSNKTIFRAMGFRDIALGIGATEAALRDEAGPWLAVSLLADIGDVAATLISINGIDRKGVITTSFLAGSAAVAAGVLLAIDVSSEKKA
ncbi:MAG: hypothetical protein WEB05_04335 [Solirubrobacterales bacterium]